MKKDASRLRRSFVERDVVLKYRKLEWTIDLAEWTDDVGGNSVMYVHNVRGPVDTELFRKAVRVETESRGIRYFEIKDPAYGGKRFPVREYEKTPMPGRDQSGRFLSEN